MRKIYDSIQLDESCSLQKVWLVCRNYNEIGAAFIYKNPNEVTAVYSDLNGDFLYQRVYTHEEYDNDFEEILNDLVINKCFRKSKFFHMTNFAEIKCETQNHIQYLLKYFKNDEDILKLYEKCSLLNVGYLCAFFCLYTSSDIEQIREPYFFIRYKICDDLQNLLAYYDAEFTQDCIYSDDYILRK